jgi:hypothetical protein
MAAVSKTRRRQPSIPKELRKEITHYLRSIARRYRDLFKDREVKNRVLRLVRALLPPRSRRRGRPDNKMVTRAIGLYRRLRRKFPQESQRETWSRVYPLVIPGYDGMSDLDQRTAREELHKRVSWRRRRRPRKIHAEIAV